MTSQWRLHPDGSFDLLTPTFQLLDAYPAFDAVPLRVLGVEAKAEGQGGRIVYRLENGVLEIVLGIKGQALTLAAALRGVHAAPHLLHPLAGARIVGATRFFRQAHGMGWGSQWFDLPTPEMRESYGITALRAEDGTALVICTRDHRRFDHRCMLAPAPRDEQSQRFAAGFLTENLPLPDDNLELPEIRFELAGSAADGLREAAAGIAREMQARTDKPTSYHWCSWYYLYHNLSEQLLDEYLAGFRKLCPSVPLQTVQIDAGYFPSCGDWLETNALFPSGLQKAFAKIKAAGYRPGIWIGPFMVGNRSRLFREHPDWVVRGLDGNPVTPWRGYNEPKVWGYRDEETYCLDSSHPGAMEYLRRVFRTMKEWGAEYFKTDFMYWGLHDSAKVRRHTPGKTSYEYLRDVLEMIRSEIGPDSFWLGCIAPFFPFVGYADGMRIGGDVGSRWSGGFNPQSMLVETAGNQHINNVFWQNDPDAILVRNFHLELSDTEITSLALWQGIMGGVINTSDPLHEVSPERLRLWRFLQPGPLKWSARLPYFGRKRKLLVATRSFANNAHAVLAFNTTDEPVTEKLDVADLVGKKEMFAYAWSPGHSTALGKQSFLLPELPPHACALYYLSATETSPGNLTLGGSHLAG